MNTINYFIEEVYDIISKEIVLVTPKNRVYKHIAVVKLLNVCIESYDKRGQWSYQIATSKSLKLLYALIAIDMISITEIKIIISKIKGEHSESMQRYLYDRFNIEHNYASNLWVRDHRR